MSDRLIREANATDDDAAWLTMSAGQIGISLLRPDNTTDQQYANALAMIVNAASMELLGLLGIRQAGSMTVPAHIKRQ